MRFLSLSNLFHRRVKSESALAELIPEPMATLVPRPASADGLDELVLAAADSPDVFAPFISAVPVSITHPLPTQTVVVHGTKPTQVVPASHSVFAELHQRIRELEAALAFQYKANKRIPALEGALRNERTALQTARDANAKMDADAAALRANLIDTQRALHAALTSPGADDRARVLAAENAALTAERLRHRKFIELMIAVGAHKPVMDRAYQALSGGAEAEVALVAAIREAVSRPDSVWASLLEPVMGPRTPEDYAAQVRCTLKARSDARDWRKRASFWKDKAKESGGHANTVTPSPSDISFVFEELSDTRQLAVIELKERRQSAIRPVDDSDNIADDDILLSSQHAVVEDPRPVSLAVSLPSALATFASLACSLADLGIPLAASTELAVISDSAITPTAAMTASHSVASVYSQRTPMASEIFRASHSQRLRRSSISFPLSSVLSRSLSQNMSLFASGSKKTDLDASASSSSMPSRSKRRRVEVVAVPNATQEPDVKRDAAEKIATTVSSVARLGYIDEASEGPAAEPAFVLLPTISSTSSSSESSPSEPMTPVRSTAIEAHIESAATSTHAATPDSDEELVIVMHHDACTPSPARARARGTTPSPDKSRLPVLKKAMRRLSISRPVLVDTTNAATFTFTTSPRGKVQGTAKTQAAAGAASPPRPSKIPMGKRIQRMDLVGSARRAVQTRTRARNGTA